MVKKISLLLCLISLSALAGITLTEKDSIKWSERMAHSVMKRNPTLWQIDENKKPKWDYKPSFVLSAFEQLYQLTNNKQYQLYGKQYLDMFVDSTGTIDHYEANEYNLDALNPGKLLFNLYQDTHDTRYLLAMQLLRKQLETQPRTPAGVFWHKKIYPNQVWTDGMYMNLPFYTRFTQLFENGKALDDVAKQFELIQASIVDSKLKLPYHAYDESKQMDWANKTTGTSPTIWCRGVGFYFMALVDVLDYFPKQHPKYTALVNQVRGLTKAVIAVQDASGLWYQVMDKSKLESNYLETSGTAMLAYAIAKSVNKGYLPNKYKKYATKAFDGILANRVVKGEDGEIHLTQISQGIGLGGNPYRDGSNKYYVQAKQFMDNSMGVGAFILAALALNR
jgi:unsaturated rhamnogalacturonyl hydrolase